MNVSGRPCRTPHGNWPLRGTPCVGCNEATSHTRWRVTPEGPSLRSPVWGQRRTHVAKSTLKLWQKVRCLNGPVEGDERWGCTPRPGPLGADTIDLFGNPCSGPTCHSMPSAAPSRRGNLHLKRSTDSRSFIPAPFRLAPTFSFRRIGLCEALRVGPPNHQ